MTNYILMKPEELKTLIEGILDAISLSSEIAQVPAIYDAISEAKRKLNEQLKLAIVGLTKAGKSTLLNALLHIDELPTGDAIVTRHVSVLLSAHQSPTKEEMAIVHMKDGQEKHISLVQYKELVDNRKVDVLNIRDKILWFDVFLNNNTLRDMNIIDTPGDDSWLNVDSENTKELFRDRSRRPDVIAYVVRKEFGVQDVKAAQDYLSKINGNNHHINGLNVVAVYNCCDELVASDIDGCDWGADYKFTANRIIENNRQKSSAFRRCFSKCIPVAGQFAMASNSINERDFVVLKKIATCEIAEFFYRDISFIEYDEMESSYPELYEIFEDNGTKEQMLKRLGLETMKYIVWWCSNNPDKELTLLKNDLEDYSNVPSLRSYLLNEHFKKLSFFYKSTSVLPELKKTIEKIFKDEIDNEKRVLIRRILELCQNAERTMYSQYGFLSVMRDYYDCIDYFDSNDWSLASQTIDFCISNKQEESIKNDLLKQWDEKHDFYESIGNYFAADASEKFIISLKSI